MNLPVDLQLKLFDSTVLPILTYGCEIWGFDNLEILERIHAEFLRNITKARKSTPHYMLYAELGRYPLDITIKSRMIGFWNRMVTGNDSNYLIYFILLSKTSLISNLNGLTMLKIHSIAQAGMTFGYLKTT